MIQRMVCPKCGEDVLLQCFAAWDSHFQRWESSEMHGPDAGHWCPSCGDIEQPVHITRSASEERLYQRMHQRASLIEEFLEDPGEQARTTEEYDLAERAAVLNRCESESVIKSIPFHEFVASDQSRGRCRWAYLRYLERMEESEKSGDYLLDQ